MKEYRNGWLIAPMTMFAKQVPVSYLSNGDGTFQTINDNVSSTQREIQVSDGGEYGAVPIPLSYSQGDYTDIPAYLNLPEHGLVAGTSDYATVDLNRWWILTEQERADFLAASPFYAVAEV